MTNDLPILALTGLLTVFFLLSVLLFILYSRNLVQLRTELEANVTHNEFYKDLYRVYQESLKKCKELSLEYTRSEANGKALNALLEQSREQRKQLRKDFVEQSELATHWRQKYDKLAKESELLHNDFIRVTELLKEADPLINEIKIKELDTLFRDPFRKPKPKGWNLKAYPRDERGRVVKPKFVSLFNSEFKENP